MSVHDRAGLTYPEVQHNTKMHLTPEELAVLKECNKEGFKKRGVPGGLALGVGSFYALKHGMLKPHPRFGILPAITISAVAGCLAGSLSYKSICVQRVMEVPNGNLRKQIEAMQGIKRNSVGPTDSLPENFDLDVQGPMVSGSQMDIYQSTNNFDGFTGDKSNGDQPVNYDTAMPIPKYSPGLSSYDDLRQRNRDEYMRSTSPRQNIPPPRPAPHGQNYPPLAGPPGPILEDSRPFDKDRVPQYNLD